MKRLRNIGIALIVGIAAGAIYVQGASAQQPRGDTVVSEKYKAIISAYRKKERRSSALRDSCGGGSQGWTCYGPVSRVCCCYRSSEHFCYSME
jgi:hypothetical protein